MNSIVNKFLLAGDKFMPEMHLRSPGLTYSACGPFTRTQERIAKFKTSGDTSHIYKNDLDKACFQHDLAYGHKDLPTRTAADKVLRDKAFAIAQDQSKDGYQRSLASMVYKFFDKKVQGTGLSSTNEDLANELHKRIIRNFKRRKVIPVSVDNIWGADLADMQLISKQNKGYRFLLCVIDLYSKYAWVVPIKDKKGDSLVAAFQKILKSGRKPSKIWVDRGSEFYNSKMTAFLKDNDIDRYSTFNEGKSVVAERFIRTLKSKLYKHMTSMSKNVYIDALPAIVEEYNNTYHSTIKMKPVEVTDGSVDYSIGENKKPPKFKVGDRIRISKYKSLFTKGYMPNWIEEIFVIKEVKKTVPYTYVIEDLQGDTIDGTLYEQELQKTKQEVYRIEKVLRTKGDKLFVKWKGYPSSQNSWIDKSSVVGIK